MCLFLVTIFLEPLYRPSSSSHRRNRNHPYRNNYNSSSSSSFSLPPYPGERRDKCYPPGYIPHPLWPNRPAPNSGQPVLVQDPRVDRIIGVLNDGSLLGNAGGLGIDRAGANGGVGIEMGRGGIDGGIAGGGDGGRERRGGIDRNALGLSRGVDGTAGVGSLGRRGLQAQQDQPPRYGVQSPAPAYGGQQPGGIGLGYNDPRFGAADIGRSGGIDGMLANRLYDDRNAANFDYAARYDVQAQLAQDYGYQAGYPGVQYSVGYTAQDIAAHQMALQQQQQMMQMQQPQMPQPAELRGGRSLSPGYGVPPMMSGGMGMPGVYNQNLYAGHAQIPQQQRQAMWGQGQDHGHNHTHDHDHHREEAPRTFGLGGRTDFPDRSERGLKRAKSERRPTPEPQPDKRSRDRDRDRDRDRELQEERRQQEARDEASRLFDAATEPKTGKRKEKDVGKERERTMMGSPSRNPFSAFSKLRRGMTSERKDDESNSEGRRFPFGRPPGYDAANDNGRGEGNGNGNGNGNAEGGPTQRGREERDRDRDSML